MRKLLFGLVTAMLLGSSPAAAALKVGDKAPDFVTTGALAGKPFKLRLSSELKKGPVILYFFPKAFTKGCTLEAHAFSEASADFAKMGAHVIGLSADNLTTLRKFSVEECRNAFPVATATKSIIKAYDVALPLVGMTNRTSFVIARGGRIAMVHSEMDWSAHVAKSLETVKALKR